MTEFIAISNSTIFDVCLNTYGTLDYLVKLMVDSGHAGIEVYPTNGQIFLFDESLAKNDGTLNLSTQYNSLTKQDNLKFATQ